MIFSSVTFLIIFLPLVLILYYSVPKIFRNIILLLASILFFAWDEPKFLFLLLSILLINYIGAILIKKIEKFKQPLFIGTILFNIVILSFFKCFNIFVDCLKNILSTHSDIMSIAIPIGISVLTFSAIGYITDVYTGKTEPQKNIIKFSLYIAMFPKLIAGPFVKYTDIAVQLDNRTETIKKFYYGTLRFFIGLSRKVIIANTLGYTVDQIIALPQNNFTPALAWLCAFCFVFQLYNDFGGYSDMAIGLCEMFGFKVRKNFNFPLLSKSVTEFLRRWNISLTNWVKEYIFIPFCKDKINSKKYYIGAFISCLIIGLWYGSTANIIIFALAIATLVIIEKRFNFDKPVFVKLAVIHHLYLFLVLSIFLFLLRSPNLQYSLLFLKRLIGISEGAESLYTLTYYIDGFGIIILITAILCSTKILKNLYLISLKNNVIKVVIDCCIFLLLIISLSSIISTDYNPFLLLNF